VQNGRVGVIGEEARGPVIELCRPTCEEQGRTLADLEFGEVVIDTLDSLLRTDQGVQFTASNFTGCLAAAGVRISMDGRGRAIDNIFVERLWRTVKYEDLYVKDYASVPALEAGLEHYFHFTTTILPTRACSTAHQQRFIMPKVRVGLLRAGVQFTTLSSNTALGCALRDSVNHSKVR
jgi:Integrase core domain